MLDKLWNKPRLKNGISAKKLHSLSHLPIQYIDMLDFGRIEGRGSNVDGYFEVLADFPQLLSLKIDGNVNLSYTTIGR